MGIQLKILSRIVIAGGNEPRSRALAGLQLLDNGELLVGYRYASNHPVGDHEKIDDGTVLTTRSTDNGYTWSVPQAVAAIPGWDCAGGNRMIQTPDGHLMMFVFQAQRANRRHPESHVYPTSSIDSGHTWGSFGAEVALFPGWTEPHAIGCMPVLQDGRWMISVYGADSKDGPTYTGVAFSKDKGLTWDNLSIIAKSPDISFYEAAILQLARGPFIAVIRTQDPPFTSYFSRSEDEGQTWTEPTPLPFRGQTPFLFKLSNQSILCIYRDRDPTQPGVGASLTTDGGESWKYIGQIYSGSDWNCGYPAMVRLVDESLFCVYYSCYKQKNSEVHGVHLKITTS